MQIRYRSHCSDMAWNGFCNGDLCLSVSAEYAVKAIETIILLELSTRSEAFRTLITLDKATDLTIWVKVERNVGSTRVHDSESITVDCVSTCWRLILTLKQHKIFGGKAYVDTVSSANISTRKMRSCFRN